MRIVVLGANGRVGSRVATELLCRGHEVTAVLHKHTTRVPEGAKTINVDLGDAQQVKTVLHDADAVVCALSSWHTPGHNALSSAMQVVISVMESLNIQRIVSISGDIASIPGEKLSLRKKIVHRLTFGVVKKVIDDSEAHIALLDKSSLDWTVVRPGIMTSSSRASYKLQEKHPIVPFISRSAVVQAVSDLAETFDFSKQSPYIF